MESLIKNLLANDSRYDQDCTGIPRQDSKLVPLLLAVYDALTEIQKKVVKGKWEALAKQ